MIYQPQCEYFYHKLHVKTPFAHLFLYAKHQKRLVKFQPLIFHDKTTKIKPSECYFLGENHWKNFFFQIWFLTARRRQVHTQYTEYQYNIAFPRKKYIRCSNAIVCQNWKFETALECAYQLSIYLGMCIMYTLYIIRCPPENPHNVMHLADLLKTFSI